MNTDAVHQMVFVLVLGYFVWKMVKDAGNLPRLTEQLGVSVQRHNRATIVRAVKS